MRKAHFDTQQLKHVFWETSEELRERLYSRLMGTAASPYTAEYGGTDAGKTAHYMLRWVNTHGEKGPWSETVAATITG